MQYSSCFIVTLALYFQNSNGADVSKTIQLAVDTLTTAGCVKKEFDPVSKYYVFGNHNHIAGFFIKLW